MRQTGRKSCIGLRLGLGSRQYDPSHGRLSAPDLGGLGSQESRDNYRFSSKTPKHTL